MLKLHGITKDYLAGNDKVCALRGIDLTFRKNEFVSILGPSGCGKTTLLNLIGGLDRYTEGDLIINGKSTKRFSDADWDAYRNHSVGFVFQSYNLIPHQSVLANVELALTLSGVSKTVRRQKAVQALREVGLEDQKNKRPGQLSGGQMQRVAIARALVNDPEILLADEPTGALDSVTSVQIMELLKNVAKDRLVIMVTHNPALAQDYSTRIIKLLDGKVVDDSMPCDQDDSTPVKEKNVGKKPSMSFLTAMSLSLNNLMTKKGRTLLTAFAGSIGIIGIALILSLSNGIDRYIDQVQEDTLSSYPVTIRAESVDLSGVLTTLMGIRRGEVGQSHELDAVYSSSVMGELINSLNGAGVNENDLESFRVWIEGDESELLSHVSDIHYSYEVDLNIYTEDANGNLRKSDVDAMMSQIFSEAGIPSEAMGSMGMSFSNMKLWEEILPGEETLVSDLVMGQYDVLEGRWPQRFDEVVLVVDKNNEISDMMLGALGFKTVDELVEQLKASSRGDQIDIQYRAFSYGEVLSHNFRLFLTPELYQKNLDQGYTLLTDTENGLDFLMSSDRGITLSISGIIRQKEDAASGMISGAIGYTAALTDYILAETEKSDLVREQQAKPETDVLLGLPFRTENDPIPQDEEKPALISEYAKTASVAEKSAMYQSLMTTPSEEYLAAAIEQSVGALDRAALERAVYDYVAAQESEGTDTSYITEYVSKMSDEELLQAVKDGLARQIRQQYARDAARRLAAFTEDQLAAALDAALLQSAFTNAQLIDLYEAYMPARFSESDLESSLRTLGYKDKVAPDVIYLYANSFRDKDAIADCIAAYNEGKSEADQITYTDYAALLMSSISTIINAISYVLVAFVAISLIVSSIMIGIITYISVLERTKEIGILRSIGASKRDVSRVFNAETLLEGFAAGIIGIGITLLLILPINAVIRSLTGIATIGAILPALGAVLLVLISMGLTYLAGLIPSGVAARKDPVEALRSE